MAKRPDEPTGPYNADWGPALVNGLTYHQRINRGLLQAIPAAQTEGGIVTAKALKKPVACLLDLLMTLGHLGRGDEAKRRLEAGMWLRTLYHEKAMMSPRSTGHYGEGRGGDYDIPEAVAWNMKVMADTMRAVPRYARLLTKVCCHDEHFARFDLIRDALDALADHRGM